jgi:hypothetical protein
MCTVYYIVMFTCTLARSHQESKRRWAKLELLSLKAINNILWTSVATRCMLASMGARPSSVYTLKGTMKDKLARCFKKTNVQVCTLTSAYKLFCNAIALLLHTYLLMTNNHCLFLVYKLCLYNNRCLFFRRLKINHDTDEFILDSGTVTKVYF